MTRTPRRRLRATERWTRDSGPGECVDKVKAAPLPRQMYHVSLWLALWGCGRRASVVQAQRQIHKAPLGRSRRRRSFVAQSLVRPALIVETEPLADADACSRDHCDRRSGALLR